MCETQNERFPLGQFPFIYSKEVEVARRSDQPIVALESTIITHGMPHPINIETAKAVENVVRKEGCTPATIAIINGQIHIGLEADELPYLASCNQVVKASRADVPFVVSRDLTASTTVAATMILARRADIAIFATGGIGGVHRGAAESFDVSADLTELSRTPVTVVSAGAKAILDVPATFEMLETLGVPVINYGSDVLPAFWCRNSGIEATLIAKTVEDIVDFLNTKRGLELEGGTLVTNPIPEEDAIENDIIDKAIELALKQAETQGIKGKDVTPFLLKEVMEATQQKALQANIALIKNNAKLAAQIAIADKKQKNR